ncbi:MAG TPA: Gfo/Idh/MocA family oxidoreductase [Bryobacteraceae bacterium]|nr:Gfo/Idh/MocA family oxidoreductase [Bryobacteraceae bacterium]
MRFAWLLSLAVLCPAQTAPLRVAIAGLVHGHVAGFLNNAVKRSDIQITAIFDPDPALVASYGERYHIPQSGRFTDLARMLDTVKPEAIATFTATVDHPTVVEAAAARHIPVMMEKPLAVDMTAAHRIQSASARTGIPVIVNYETTWYRSHHEIWTLFKDRKAAGAIRRMVAMDGHQGPKEIHVQPEFFAWLTDPAKNGAGAMFDFGCYGANLMTWLMDNQRPLKVTALAQTHKPAIYPNVDDDATILVQYPSTEGVIEASWDWPFNRKDFEVYGQTGYAIATGGDNLRVRLSSDGAEQVRELPEMPPDEHDSIAYLTAVARHRIQPSGLSSLENNLIVTEILQAARESVRSGKTVALQ